jgi:hypothetical protein
MSRFEQALNHCAASPHGVERVHCLRAALEAHQAIMMAATGKTDKALTEQIKEIDLFLQDESKIINLAH